MSNKKESILEIKFATPEAAEHFMIWLSESGEQDYWMWMEERESEEDGDITAVNFNYPFPRTKKNKDNFTIGTNTGRMDDKN